MILGLKSATGIAPSTIAAPAGLSARSNEEVAHVVLVGVSLGNPLMLDMGLLVNEGGFSTSPT